MLNVLSFNAQSFHRNYEHITQLIHDLEEPSVLTINELWSPLPSSLNLDNYQKPFYKLRNTKRGGGVGLWFKKGIKIVGENDLSSLKLSVLEAVSATVMIDEKCVTVVSLYRAPSHDATVSMREFNRLFEYLSNLSSLSLVSGDTNIDMFKHSTLRTDFCELLDLYSLTQTVSAPTRITSTTTTLIDHVITNKEGLLKTIVLEEGVSDHQAILSSCFDLTTNTRTPKTNVSRTFLNYNKTVDKLCALDWNQIETQLLSMSANEGIIFIVKLFHDNFVFESVCRRKSKPIKPWMNEEGLRLRKVQLNKRRIFLKNRNDTTELAYKGAKRSYNKYINKLKKEYYHNLIFEAKGNGKATWKVINEVLHRKKSDDQSRIVLEKDGILLEDDVQIANEFNDYYINVAVNLAKTIPPADISVEMFLENVPKPDDHFSYEHVSREFMLELFKSLSTKKSSGPDQIPSLLLHKVKHQISGSMAIIFNKSLDESEYPKALREAFLIPLFKSGSPTLASNFRPIANLNSICKLFQKASNHQTNHYENKNAIIPSTQFGFKSNSSTVDPLMILRDYIDRKTSEGEFVFLCAIDLKKCFDTVDTETILPIKLRHFNYSENAIKYRTSFFLDRTQYVTVNGVNSDIQPTKNISVVQGSSVGPNSFNAYVADMPYSTNFFCLFFADDTTFLHSDPDPIKLIEFANVELNKVKQYFQANLLSLNVKKTVYTLFPPKKVKLELHPWLILPKVHIGNTDIEYVSDFKFLGVTLENSSLFTIHFDNVMKKIKSGVAALYKVKHLLPTKTKILIFNALIKPHYEYGAIVWIPSLTLGQINQIIKYQKRALRLIYSMPHCHTADLFKKSGIVKFDLLFVKLSLELVHKYYTGSQPLEISKLLNHFYNSESTRKSARFNFKIPPHLKKGHLFYNIMDTWNNSSEYIKKIIVDEKRPGKNFSRKIKARIKDYINSKYPICTMTDCYACAHTYI